MIRVEEIPAHANAVPHRRVMEAAKAASKSEIREALVAAGIITLAGVLAAHYRRPPRKTKSKSKASKRRPSKACARRSRRR